MLVLVIVMGRARFLERRALRASISGVLGGDYFVAGKDLRENC